MPAKPKTRLYLDAELVEGAIVPLSDMQANYLLATLRLREGDHVAVFNGHAGEWRAELIQTGKRSGALRIVSLMAPHTCAPDIWLVFAPVKNEKIDYTVRRATELGVSALLPVRTQRTIVTRINAERLRANTIEAAEQCGRCDVPRLHELHELPALLGSWPQERTLLFCDESGRGSPIPQLLPGLPKASPYALLIGPEGGFTAQEQAMIRALPQAKGLSLGPRILRAETAALAALANVMAWLGDWHLPSNFTPPE